MIAIIDYGAGNIRSVQNALSRLGKSSVLTSNPQEILAAEKVILPGVGEAKTAMNSLKDKGLVELIPQLTQPFLGICLGLQLMCRHSEEGQVDCLGIFDAKVVAFPKTKIVPHMGWNSFTEVKGELFNGLSAAEDQYFVHGYAATLCDSTTAICDYIFPFSAAMEKSNFYATQFHPEKSAEVGERLLKNFLEL